MSNAYITGTTRDQNGNLYADVSVQSDTDPLSFTNYSVLLDPSWSALPTRQDKINAIMLIVGAMRKAAQPPPDTSFTGQGTV